MEDFEKDGMRLPDNAFRELKEGEEYRPVMDPQKAYPEVNGWSVTWGVLMTMLFSAAAAYLGLRVGQVFEAAIPIAIIAVGVSTAAKRRNPLGENVIIQSIGACSGAVVAGAIFTLPAIYILEDKYPGMGASFIEIFLSSLLGGVLGILFLIPFRKYFVSDMHGKYPFPEATATTQVLVSGAKGGNQAKPLLLAGLVGGLYDFAVATFGLWNENFTTRVVAAGETLAERAKLVFKVNTGAAVLGLGYIVGLKYALIICLGSLAVWWLIVPGMALLFGGDVLNQWNPSITTAVGDMSPEDIFANYGKSIGNGQTLDFSDTLEIIRLDADTMSLGKEGRYRVDYARADFMTSGGYSLLDSLAMPSSGSVLDIRRFGGLVQTLSGDAACTLTLYTYDNGGDGVYRFVTNPGTDAAAEQVGRMFTLRGDATDENAVVYELRPFEGGATLHFRFLGDRLEWLDGALAPTDASGKYTLTRK